MRWTGEQKTAIIQDTGRGNLLVSAAAGSGKTAVLVERVLQKILQDKSSVDRLLIVTFTEAAASEMCEKIVKRLREYILDPTLTADVIKKIKNQIRLTETADIMTIDAFCYRVVQNNFHALGIDPDIRICDDSMVKLMQKEAMDNMFRRLYKDENAKKPLGRLMEFYAQDRSNDKLEKVILSIHSFADSFSEPMKWVECCANDYKKPINQWPSVKYHINATKESAQECLDTVLKIKRDFLLSQDVASFADTLENICTQIVVTDNWDDIYNVYCDNFATKKKLKVFEEIIESLPQTQDALELCHAFVSFTDIFNKGNDKIAIGITKPFSDIEAAYSPELLQQEAEDIAWIVSEFNKDYALVKERKGVYEFSDLEHLTYMLFHDNSFVREEYKNKYDEILIDEYQDTNMLQDSIFNLISHDNIFMVGDLKQSIYRFRKGDPYIFKGKSENYANHDVPHDRIILSQNFRSRQEILHSVNDIFSKIMSKSAGDIDYRDGELITRDNDFEYYPPSNISPKSELHYLAVDRSAELDTSLCEARFTAQKIYELLNSNATVYDKSLGIMRPVRKKDIVILRSSVKGVAKVLTDELSRLGIDSYVDKSSFFDRCEINIMLSLLTVINNSHQDIPLVAVMRSPIGGFTDDELAKIRIHTRSAHFFIDAVFSYAETGKEADLSRRCNELLRNIQRWRAYIRKKTVAQLIWAIYEETCFYDIMGAIDENDEAQTNLRLLFERAKAFESAGFKGLFNFIKYIERLESDTTQDLGGAKLMSENHDVVRIMTIHKSKGLEFPIVFLLGTGSDFRTNTDSPAVRLHKNLGFGLSHIYYDKHFARDTYAKELIKKVNHTENLSEQMRLLYVALTRPREKLYVVAARKTNADATEESTKDVWCKSLINNKFTPSTALGAKGFHSWLCPAALASHDTWEVKYIPVKDEIPIVETEPIKELSDYTDSPELKDAVYKILDYAYPYELSNAIPSRTSVTQLKELELEHYKNEVSYEPEIRSGSDIDDVAQRVLTPLQKTPKFMQKNDTKPANEIGTIYHLVMSKINLNKIREIGITAVDDELERIIAEDIISAKDMEYVDNAKIKAFFTSELAERMLDSKNIRREESFQINISALEYDPSLPNEYKNETVVLQGIIDCFFETNNGYVLFDYKTDKVHDKAEIRSKYEKQLTLYAKAIEKLTGKPVTEKYLYLFDTGETV